MVPSFTGAVIALIVMLSMILTASVLYPEISGELIVKILVAGVATIATFVAVSVFAAAAGPCMRRTTACCYGIAGRYRHSIPCRRGD
jgi:hypothetical protein